MAHLRTGGARFALATVQGTPPLRDDTSLTWDPREGEEYSINPSELYRVTLETYSSPTAVERYAAKLLPKRKRSLRRVIRKFLNTLPYGARVLDVGSGTGMDVDFMRKAGFKAEGIDSSEEMVELAKARVGMHFRTMDVRRVDQRAGITYEGVLCLAVLQHICRSDVSLVLGNVRRLIVDGGLYLLITKEGVGEAWDYRLGHEYPRAAVFYRRDELQRHLTANSFRVKKVSTFMMRRDGVGERWLAIMSRAV